MTAAISALLWLAPPAARAEDFLDVDRAFVLQAEPAGDGLRLAFSMPPGYHLYRERLSFESDPSGLRILPPELPTGTVVHDANFDRDMEIYVGQLRLALKFAGNVPAGGSALLRVGYQGCADAGLCYPPQLRTLRVEFAADTQVRAVNPVTEADLSAPPATSAAVPAAPAAPAVAANQNARIQSVLASRQLLTIAGAFLLAGLLLSFTPCVLPMVPILSSIIVGQAQPASRAQGFSLALAYSLGMALVYTAFGMVAGLLGEGLAASLQNPWVLGAFGLLMATLALSMFGVYELQMPSAIQTRLTLASGKLRGGTHLGVFAMGGLSALIVGPCVAAPLAGALVYISQTRDVLIGGVALFSLAAGMSLPLLLVGLSAGALLPRAGRWMEVVKRVMGVMLLMLAWWMVSPVLPTPVAMLLLAALLAFVAGLLGAFHTLEAQAGLGRLSAKAMGWLLACAAVAQLAGALSGGDSPWTPLRHFASRSISLAAAQPGPAELRFRSLSSNAGLDQALREAGGRPVMLDFYADWCVACKELEHRTFADPRVQARAAAALLLRADVTSNDHEARALLKRFGLFGPPGVLFFGPSGSERGEARVIGFQDAEQFLRSLDSGGL
ncbi:MAG: protein-disulfide reductase DsbD [Stagnimonas sp.]|nr:protein-disulfide reductase DsbD [Stagnimonas sp.]